MDQVAIDILETLIQGLADTFLVLLVLVIAKIASDWFFRSGLRSAGVADARERTVDYQIEEQSNLAVALRRCGLGIGFGLGLAGVVADGVARFSQGLDAVLMDTREILIYCAVLLIFFFVAQFLSERVVLGHVQNAKELLEGNLAVGFAEFGILVATGLIAYGSFHGEGGGWETSVAFFAMGQVALIAFAFLYEWATPFDCMGEIRDGNTAAGVILSGTLISLGIVLSFAVSGPFEGWTEGITGFAVSGLAGMVLLVAFQRLIDKAFLPNTTLKIEVERDRNVAASSVTVCAQIALAIMIGSLVA